MGLTCILTIIDLLCHIWAVYLIKVGGREKGRFWLCRKLVIIARNLTNGSMLIKQVS